VIRQIAWPLSGLVTATIILQSHAVPFWLAEAGAVGVVWSLGAELLAYQFLTSPADNRGTLVMLRAAGVLSAAVVVGGPTMQAASPLAEELRTDSAQTRLLEHRTQSLTRTIRLETKQAEKYRGMAEDTVHYEDKPGDYIEQAEKAEHRAREARKKLQEVRARMARIESSKAGWESIVKIALHLGILAAAFIASLTTPARVRGAWDSSSGAVVEERPGNLQTQQESPGHVEPQAGGEETVRERRRRRIAERLKRHITDSDHTQVSIAREIARDYLGDESKHTSLRPKISRALQEAEGSAPSTQAPDSVFDVLERYLDSSGA
jgi:hypothetical protein